ncbi:hypothetical protein [Microbacterium sp. No. 7]|uniref:hypothetical protein n=1 Tax=Microbacterium sp. No. 7 TaxID=1714373 RepID=UPI000ADDE846|nr:hypothetical protein [Microbacterium sp. No. 7]
MVVRSFPRVSLLGFGALSNFGILLLEIFTAILIYQRTSSFSFVLLVVFVQMIVEAGMTYVTPFLLRKMGPASMIVWFLPFRIVGCLFLLGDDMSAADALIAGVLISLSTTGDAIPRNVLLTASTRGSASRGMDLGLFEAFRYIAVALSPLVGAYAFEGGGFVALAGLSSGLSLVAALCALRVQRYVGRGIREQKGKRIGIRRIPVPILALWCSTGARYLAENTLYPVAAIMLYQTSVSLGWISLLAVAAGVIFGKLSDRLSGNLLILLPVCAVAVGWFARSFELTFASALLFGVICGVGSKAVGVLEKKISFDFGDTVGPTIEFVTLRERIMLISRAALIGVCLLGGFSVFVCILVCAIVMVLNIATVLFAVFVRRGVAPVAGPSR